MISGLVTVISFARKCKSAAQLLVLHPDDLDEVEASKKGALITQIGAQPTAKLATQKSDHFGLDKNSCSSSTCDSSASSSSATNSMIIINNNESSSSSFSLHNEHQGASQLEPASSSARSLASSSEESTTASSSRHLAAKTSSQSSSTAHLADIKQHGSLLPADFQPFVWLLMRYLRLTPSYATVIGLSILVPTIGAPGGPFWPETMGQLEPACRNNWWANLLYVNNFYETDKLCLIHSWYLSNDWQFFLLALCLFGLMYISKKLALLLMVSVFLASSAATFSIIVANDFPPTIVTTSPAVAERWQFIHSLYYKPWPHLPAYLIGLFVGYLILLVQKQQEQQRSQAKLGPEPKVGETGTSTLAMAPGWRLACWLLFGSVAIALLNSIYPWNMGIAVDPLVAGLHGATFRTLWAACNAWLVFALIISGDKQTGSRNLLGQFLSWRGFQLTSRLTYCAYLVHPLIIYYHFGVLRERIDSSLYGQTFRFLATLLLSYLFAFLLSLLVESPSIQLQRFLINLFGPQSKGISKQTEPPAKHWPEKGSRGGGTTDKGQSSRKKSKSKETDQAGGRQGEAVSCRVIKKRKKDKSDGKEVSSSVVRKGSETAHFSGPQAAPDSSGNNTDSVNSVNNSALDMEFQRKLAHAIGKGFKIRTRLVAAGDRPGPSINSQARLVGMSKGRPDQSPARHPNRLEPGRKMVPFVAAEAQLVHDHQRHNHHHRHQHHQFLAPSSTRTCESMDQLVFLDQEVPERLAQLRPSPRAPPPPPPPPPLLRPGASGAGRGARCHESFSTFICMQQQHQLAGHKQPVALGGTSGDTGGSIERDKL